jgi:DNA-binding MarR family transcriptional regulator
MNDRELMNQWCRKRIALRTAYYRARKVACALLEPHGLTPSRYQVLLALDEARAPVESKSALARKIGVSPSTMHHLVRALETGGFLTCSAVGSDRRQVRLTLTDEGRGRFKRAKKSFESAEMAAAGYLLQAAMGATTTTAEAPS